MSHTRHMPHPSRSSWFDHQNDIWWGVQSIKLLVCRLIHSPVTSFLLRSDIFLSTLKDQASHPYETTGKITVLYIFINLLANWKTKDSTTNYSKHSRTSIWS
jgi:hypothetical protein